MPARAAEPARLAAMALAAALLAAGAVVVASRSSPALPLAGLVACAAALAAVLRPMAVLQLGIALIPLELVQLPVGAVGVTVTEGLVALAGLGWALGRIIDGRPPFVATAMNRPIALLLLSVVPGLAIAEDSFPVVRILVMWTLFALAFQLVVDDGRPETVRRLLAVLVGAASVVAVISIVRSGGRAPQLDEASGVALGRATGAFTDPNILATFLGLALPATLALAIAGRGARRLALLVAFAVVLAGLGLSLSRGGILASGAALALMLAWRPFRRVAAPAAVVLVALAVVNANPLVGLQEVDTVLERVVSVTSASQGPYDQRLEIYRTAPQMIVDHPLFGVGANEFSAVAPSYGLIDPVTGLTFDHAHDIVLTVAIELGLLGLVALLWATAVLTRLLWRACVRAPVDRAAAVAVAAALTGVAVQGLVDYTVRSNVIVAVISVLAASGVVLAQPPRPATAA